MNLRDRIPSLALIAQALLQLVWHGLLQPPRSLSPWLVVVVAVLPLTALIPAALHSYRRMLMIGGIVSLLYLSHGVMELWSNPLARSYAALEVLFALAAIFGLRKMPKSN
ncbi:MAG: DUF2069 domain-containing protein [Rhodanobacteraceae bacterium]|nr:DUF2069 domain-containing protein [Rhodanobacteraceae bacterium]MBK7043367.1 DUF2069 domain-containing protein [Rhodanobacteraceae bacterium]MBP9154135.1 DUF2069 domain-containing protein [Xanthomonadales bacterium]HQW82156.1 DUF2069 domain-containing protein [Pseudomonadota bacterium]